MLIVTFDPPPPSFGNPAVPPDILDYPTSNDMVVKEGSNVTLKCSATGSPAPTITFRREDGEPIILPGGAEGQCNEFLLVWK